MGPSKYIVMDIAAGPTVVIFPNYVDHNMIAGDNKVLSAGYFDIFIENGKISVTVFGASLTLHQSPQEGDDMLIAQLINHRQFE